MNASIYSQNCLGHSLIYIRVALLIFRQKTPGSWALPPAPSELWWTITGLPSLVRQSRATHDSTCRP